MLHQLVNRLIRRRIATFSLGLGLCLGGTSLAFDTGHHADLTREVMAEFGMSDTAIRAAQVGNWLVDYYSTDVFNIPAGIRAEASKLHADRLSTPQAVTNYWDRLTINTRAGLQEAARNNNPRQVVALLGMSLHVVQDFYSHSNWAELQAPPAGVDYATLTWFDSSAAQRAGVKTGIPGQDNSPDGHGTYTGAGMNHDAYGRPNWDKAYVLAYAGARQWTNQAKTWVSEVNPAVWEQARTLTLEGKYLSRLNSDYNAMYRLSEWVKTDRENGHWKGSGSGVRKDFLTFGAYWTGFTLDSVFVEDFKNRQWHQLLSGGLRGSLDLGLNTPPPTPAPPVARFVLNKKAVFLRTVLARDLNGADKRLGIGTSADLYARITVGNQEFTEAMQLDQNEIRPAWTTIKFLDAGLSTTAVHYELWDEDQPSSSDEHLDIHPAGNQQNLDFLYNLNTHQIGGVGLEGVFDSPGRLLTMQGTAEDRGRVQFFITTKTLAQTGIRTVPGRGGVLVPITPPVVNPGTP